MRVLLIVDPVAPGVTAEVRRDIERSLHAEHDVTVAETEQRGHAVELARRHSVDQDAVVVLGGDGTVNEVACGMVAVQSSALRAPLPGGSTNVFARTIGRPAGCAPPGTSPPRRSSDRPPGSWCSAP